MVGAERLEAQRLVLWNRYGPTVSQAKHNTAKGKEDMKAATVVGIVLIVIGIFGFAMGGFSFTHEKKDVDMGPIQIQHRQKKTVPIPPILSAIALAAGLGLVVVGVRSK